MLSILRTEPAGEELAVAPGIHFEDAKPAEPAEFELVLGRRQVASVLFVATVVIAVFSALSYLVGKSLAPPPVEIVKTVEIPVIEAVPLAQSDAAPAKPAPPLFAEPKQGPLYLQMGAVEKGIAIIFAEGLRKRGFEAFVAPGPNENIFRVLIGPLADETSYQKAKEATDRIGLGTFARRYPQ